MTDYLIAPLLLGLPTGMYCFTSCVPLLASYLVSEEHKNSLRVILEFMLGCFLGYLIFGIIVEYLGEKTSSLIINIVVSLGLISLSLLMIVYSIGVLKDHHKVCVNRFKKARLPFVMGLLTGVNVCPPFLMSLGAVFKLHMVMKGIIYYIMFFIGTSVYFIPVVLLGKLNKIPQFRLVARIASLIVGVVYFVYSLSYINNTILAIKNNEVGLRGPYYSLFIALPLIILYFVSRSILKDTPRKRKIHLQIWKVLLLLSFLISGILGMILVYNINSDFSFSLPFDALRWHVNTGIAMVFIIIFHIIDYRKKLMGLFKSSD